MSSDERGRSSYLDLLINTLMEHEKNLDRLVRSFEEIYDQLLRNREEVKKKDEGTALKGKNTIPSDEDTIVYMKIKVKQQTNEMIKIVEALKD